VTLSAGTRLGPYEILAPLGAGGMGEVYKARDTRLDRTVAIKVLPPHLSSSAELRERFEREAKTISQISHPHICALYDVNREGETEYLVMELLEGETLSARLAKGALPLEQALRYGVEIADALDKAHRQGIVHRDLKPGNVMLTKSGVKLLDFGLAKALQPEGPVESFTSAPTAANVTREGMILGTLSYMAPEQLEGKKADPRADIFALGATLYEMATGKKAFEGASQASLISAIFRDEPRPISQVQPMTPPELDRVVKTCLAKDPDDRWQSAHDVATELKWIADGGSQTGMPVAARSALRPRIAWMLAAVFAAVAAVALLLASRPGRGPEPLAFRQLNFRREAIFQAAFAVGGETVVYSAAVEGNTPQIFTVRPDYPEPQSLGPRGRHAPARSLVQG
jgi:eukaryotic-like serine/threonine-protein kinase